MLFFTRLVDTREIMLAIYRDISINRSQLTRKLGKRLFHAIEDYEPSIINLVVPQCAVNDAIPNYGHSTTTAKVLLKIEKLLNHEILHSFRLCVNSSEITNLCAFIGYFFFCRIC